jgi:hypothetical protein
MIDIENLYKPLLEVANKLIDEINSKLTHRTCFISQGYRSIEYQNDLYAQGRTKQGKIVTNAKGGWSFHNYGMAFDLAFKYDNKLDWTVALFKVAGDLSKKYNLEWGGDWKVKDYPHFQIKGITIEQLRQGIMPTNYDLQFAKQHAGKIFLAVEDGGRAYYVNPKTLKAEFMGNTPATMLKYVQKPSVHYGISNKDLKKLID